MKCRTVTQFIAVGVSVALVVLFCILAQSGSIMGGTDLMNFYTASASTYLTPASDIGYVVWALAAGAVLTAITMFVNPHRETGKIAGRLAILFALANLLGASWILFASYAGGSYPEMSWVAFLALALLWILNIVMVERADLGMRWRQSPIMWTYRVATGRGGYGDDDDEEENGPSVEAGGRGSRPRKNRYRRANRRTGEFADDDDEADGCCDNVIDFSSQNATELRASYGNGARAIHFFFIELPIGATFGAVSILMLATLAQMVDHFSASSNDVSVATSVLIAIIGLLIALVYSLGRGLHPYAIGSAVVVLFQYLKQRDLGMPSALLSTSLATLIILGVVILFVSVLRIYRFIYKSRD